MAISAPAERQILARSVCNSPRPHQLQQLNAGNTLTQGAGRAVLLLVTEIGGERAS